jgi:hypothetical protein
VLGKAALFPNKSSTDFNSFSGSDFWAITEAGSGAGIGAGSRAGIGAGIGAGSGAGIGAGSRVGIGVMIKGIDMTGCVKFSSIKFFFSEEAEMFTFNLRYWGCCCVTLNLL